MAVKIEPPKECKHLLKDPYSTVGYRCWDYKPCEHIIKNEVNCPLMDIMRNYVNGKYKTYNPMKQKMLDTLHKKQTE